MKPVVRKLLLAFWPLLLLAAYLIYAAVVQYSALPSTFSSLRDADKCAWHLKFPWIGLAFLKGSTDRPGESMRMYAVEYLLRQKDRIFVVAGKDGQLGVIDEFVSARTPASVELKERKLRYLD